MPRAPRPVRAMPTGRVRRTALPAAVLLRSGAAQALAAARALTRGETSAREIPADERLAASATRAARTMGEMKTRDGHEETLLAFIKRGYDPIVADQPYTYAREGRRADGRPD